MKSWLMDNAWREVRRFELPRRVQKSTPVADLNMSTYTRAYIKALTGGTVYHHQREALIAFKSGDNVCLATSTASGKSLVFYAAGLDTLAESPKNRILAIYPLRALGREQKERWVEALRLAGINGEVGVIDGHVPVNERRTIVGRARVLILTPDVMHAWLLPNVYDRSIKAFLKNLALVVVDEVHTYTGVFGSNAAFLFRRLRHLLDLIGAYPPFICASATVAKPEQHLQKLFGLRFHLIDNTSDTSPRHEMTLTMLEPPETGDYLSSLTNFLREVGKTHQRYIAFVDSRKQTELISSILARAQTGQGDDADAEASNEQPWFDGGHLRRLDVLPYRAGYETQDRELIERRLSDGSLRGVISTSALELGLDIKGLDAAVLIGVPTTATSLWQRMGRVGRHMPGTVYVLKSGGIYDEVVFRDPERLMKRPLPESSLYLENQRIQYLHALCLARIGGEHDQLLGSSATDTDHGFGSPVDWPGGFLELCRAERIGEIPVDLQSMKSEAGEDPNHVFPLRDVETQFKVELKQGPLVRDLGSLSHGQLLREAYPGAVYYYTGGAYRVYRVHIQSKRVYVRQERQYTTSPQNLPTQVFPNVSPGNVYQATAYGPLLVFESAIQVREALVGFKEKRGRNQISCTYPYNSAGVFFDHPRFTRNYFTTGVVFTHPTLSHPGVDAAAIAQLVYEAFLMTMPFDRQDIHWAVDKHRSTRGPVSEGSKFFALYDRTYGSLRLSSRIMDGLLADILRLVSEMANLNISEESEFEVNEATKQALNTLIELATQQGTAIHFDNVFAAAATEADLALSPVIMPGSVGIAINHNNDEFLINDVFYSPRQNTLCYRGKYATQPAGDSSMAIWPVEAVKEVPGESKLGHFNPDTGELHPMG